MDSKDGYTQLALLRKLTEWTGVLSEAQVVNLKMWPLLAAPHAKTSEFTWNPPERSIIFNLKLTRRKPPKDLEDRWKGLYRSVVSILGQVTMTVKAGQEVLYVGITPNSGTM